MYGAHLEALAVHYPVLQALVGDDWFEALSRRYVQAEPARAPDLGCYGGEMAAFLARFEPAGELPYLPDVARLEWAWHIAGLAEPAPPFDLEGLGAWPEADQGAIALSLPPRSTLLASPYPLLGIYRLAQAGDAGSEAISLDGPGERLLVYRHAAERRMDPLEPDQHAFLAACAAGRTLGELAEARVAIDRLLPVAVARGWLVGWTMSAVHPPAS
jgi:hypothetical protein